MFRAPRLWIFFSSLQEAFFSTLLVFTLAANDCGIQAPGFHILRIGEVYTPSVREKLQATGNRFRSGENLLY
jgi:hypothetical protein